jgi:hypothetical protein
MTARIPGPRIGQRLRDGRPDRVLERHESDELKIEIVLLRGKTHHAEARAGYPEDPQACSASPETCRWIACAPLGTQVAEIDDRLGGPLDAMT